MKHKKHKKHKPVSTVPDNTFTDIMDNTFSFIAGYTSGGAPYGTTWQEIGIDPMLPFEEKVRIYTEGSYTPPELTYNLSSEDRSTLFRILMNLEDYQAELESIGSSSGITDLFDAIDYIEMAIDNIGVWLADADGVVREIPADIDQTVANDDQVNNEDYVNNDDHTISVEDSTEDELPF